MSELICGPIQFDWRSDTIERSDRFTWSFIGFTEDTVRRRRLTFNTKTRKFSSSIQTKRDRELAPDNQRHLRAIYLPSCVRMKDLPGATPTERLRSMLSEKEVAHALSRSINR